MTITARSRSKTDREIQQDVQAELNRDWHFKPAEIGVEVDAGVVTLSGTVSSYAKIGQAAEVAARVPGVKDVANKLAVELADGWKRDDTKIAAIIRDALIWDVDVPEERIDAIVRNGFVTLKGSVGSWYERQCAADAIKHLTGVKGVDNQILIVPAPRNDLEIRDDLKSALRRRLPFSDIDVAVDRATVTLRGTVGSYTTLMDAEDVARGTAGVKSVLNKIVVDYF